MSIRVATPLGAWRVSEYVYNPDGSFAGIIRQRRELLQLPNGKTRVIQYCTPEPELAGHPMGEFNGKRMFELTTDGRARRYHGPEVVGTGLAWGEGAMTGRGLWPLFGHNFSSFAVRVHSERQIAGGKFFNATEMIANIIGLAIPERHKSDTFWPDFSGPQWPGEVAHHWYGTRRTINADGSEITEVPIERHYDGMAWVDTLPDGKFGVQLEPNGPRWRVSGAIEGLAKRYGWLLEIEAHTEFGTTFEFLEVLDADQGYIIGIRRWYIDDVLKTVEIIKLQRAAR